MSVNTVGVQLSNASLRYNDSEHATLSGLSLCLNAGKWTVLLGRSGCGKTTVLRYLAGLLDDKVEWQGALATSDELPLMDRIAYMAQQDLLLPWLSVIDNVCLSHRFQNPAAKHQSQASNKQAQTNQALDLLTSVGLADYANAMPDQLSGGMRQRVALARTLMQDKPVVLMDEPSAARDARVVERGLLRLPAARGAPGRSRRHSGRAPRDPARHVRGGGAAARRRRAVPAARRDPARARQLALVLEVAGDAHAVDRPRVAAAPDRHLHPR